MRAGAIALYEEALREQTAALVMRTADGRSLPLQVSRWCGPPDTADEELLRHCRGPVLDVGCGPGRLTVALAERGIPALGVDISRAAVVRVREAGAAALHRSVFDPLPGQGRWATVLLADGNIGIGGLPACLLHRCAQLLAPSGRMLIEAEPGNVDEQLTAWLEHADGRRGPVFPWARMGMPALLRATEDVGLQVVDQWCHSGRAFASVAARPWAQPLGNLAVKPTGSASCLVGAGGFEPVTLHLSAAWLTLRSSDQNDGEVLAEQVWGSRDVALGRGGAADRQGSESSHGPVQKVAGG